MQVDPPSPDSPLDELHPLARALIDAHATIAPKVAAANTAHVVDLLETFEADIGPMVAPIAQRLRENPNTPPDLHPLLDALIAPPHFGVSLAISFALGAIISPVIGSAFAPAVQEIENAAWAVHPSRPLSPDVLAAAVLKGVQPEAAAAGEAVKSGYSAGAFGVMVQTAGQAVGLEQALLLWRRGNITDAQLTQVMQYSNLNPRFYDMVRALKYVPLSVGEAVTAALKGHMSDAEAAKAVGLAGIDPAHFPVLKASAGRPPGIEQMLHLWNRGVATQANVEAAVRQSDINDAYLPFVLELRKYFPPPRSIVPMLRSNSITEAQARTLLTYYGVDAQWVDAFIKEAHTTKTSAGKDLTQAQIVRAYGVQQITRAEAAAKLTVVGYDAVEIGLLLDYAEAARKDRLDNALITKIGNLYVAHKLTKVEAVNALNTGHIPNATQHDLFATWDIERGAVVHTLSAGQVVGAYRRTYITPAACKRRLLEVGVQPADLGLVVANGWPPNKITAARAAADAVVNA